MLITGTMASQAAFYPIGTPGIAWGDAERSAWRAGTIVSRSYFDEVVSKIDDLRSTFDVEQYGALDYDVAEGGAPLPMFAVKTKGWDAAKPAVLVTGGVHGYETSGVQGALLFLATKAAGFAADFNICVAPCVSPWGYQRVQRWNALAVDPNRSFLPHAPQMAAESGALMAFVRGLGVGEWLAHVDLHETTDSDEGEFRPAKAARDGAAFEPGNVSSMRANVACARASLVFSFSRGLFHATGFALPS